MAQQWRVRRRIGDCSVELATAASNWRLRRRIGDCGAGLATAAPKLATAASDWRLRRRIGDCGAGLATAAHDLAFEGQQSRLSPDSRQNHACDQYGYAPILPIARPYCPHSCGTKSGVEPRPNTISLLRAPLTVKSCRTARAIAAIGPPPKSITQRHGNATPHRESCSCAALAWIAATQGRHKKPRCSTANASSTRIGIRQSPHFTSADQPSTS